MNFKVLAMASVLAGAALAGSVSAATINAISVEVNGVITTLATNTTTRSDAGNALGASNAFQADKDTFGGFYSLGFGTATFTFGTNFGAPGSVIEVTGGTRSSVFEEAIVSARKAGSSTFDILGTINNQGVTDLKLTFALPLEANAVYNALRFEKGLRSDGDGFDIDSVSVSAVPVPAAGLLLLGALGGLAALRRRRSVV